MSASNQSDPPSQTPEQLLKLVDLQIAQMRARRAPAARNRTMLLTAGILLILGAAAFALLILLQQWSEMPRPNRPADADVVERP